MADGVEIVDRKERSVTMHAKAEEIAILKKSDEKTRRNEKAMIPPDIKVSRHARMRFITRSKESLGQLLARPMHELRRLLDAAQPAELGAAVIYRMLNNHMQGAHYFEAEGWRFVMSDDMQTLITVERMLFKKKTKRKGRRP
jgi:hypothetical protein